MVASYPERGLDRDRWIIGQRGERAAVDPLRPAHFLIEPEPDPAGEVVPVATVFLTNRECPYRCAMCDLWKHTLTETVPAGAIPAQIDFALSHLPSARQVKLYNSGSFFDPHAIPPGDYPAIANRLPSFERVIVESHPSFIGERVVAFRDLLPGKLEVAIGLETAHPTVLAKLNKRMSLDSFARAARFLTQHDVALRVFILVQPPFLAATEALEWCRRSIDFAFDRGASVCSVIPTRFGNGALEALEQLGQFSLPRLSLLEEALDYGINLQRGRVFADLWDLERFARCPRCFAARRERLQHLNLTQTARARIECTACTDSADV